MKKFLAFIFCICFCFGLLGSGLSIFAEENYADAAEIYIPDDGMATAPIVMKRWIRPRISRLWRKKSGPLVLCLRLTRV